MKPAEFVQSLKLTCSDGAVHDCVNMFIAPPGRKPSGDLVQISEWFNALPENDRGMVVRVMRETADATLFGVLCVIDGVRAIEGEGEKSQFTLIASRAGIESPISPSETYLHDLLRAEP